MDVRVQARTATKHDYRTVCGWLTRGFLGAHPTTPTRRAHFRAHTGDRRRRLPSPRRRRARRHRRSNGRRRRLQSKGAGGPLVTPCVSRQGRPDINDIGRRKAAKAAV
eukprot:scaffold78983_cov75-Phaeocystis_antarctica.AAC.3